MKTYLIPLMLMLTLMSCRGDLNADFRKVIIEYQKKFPPTKDSNDSTSTKKYIYEVYFSPKGADTTFAVTGTYATIKDDFYHADEIYQDSEVKPVVIHDRFNLSANLVYKKLKTKNMSFWDAGDEWDQKYTTLYRYKVKNNKITFMGNE